MRFHAFGMGELNDLCCVVTMRNMVAQEAARSARQLKRTQIIVRPAPEDSEPIARSFTGSAGLLSRHVDFSSAS